MLSPAHVLVLMRCLMLEQRIVVLSRNYTQLTLFIEAALSALSPFQWNHVNIPLLPDRMRDFVDAPWPFLVGLSSQYEMEVGRRGAQGALCTTCHASSDPCFFFRSSSSPSRPLL